MIVKEFTGLDTCNKNRVFVEVTCDVCSGLFTRQKRLLKQHTCSIQCSNVLKGSAVRINCDNCGIFTFKATSKLANSKSGKYFCSRACKDTAQSYMKEIQPAHYGNGTGVHSYRDKAFRVYKPICTDCGFTNILALEVHHLDKDRSNNDIDNLVILCANCHSIRHKLNNAALA